MHRLALDLVELTYANAPPVLIAGLVLAVVLVLALSSVTPTPLLLGWLSAVAVIVVARLALVVAYRRRRHKDRSAAAWAVRYTLGSALSGAGWGATALLLANTGSQPHQVLVVLVIGGMAATSVATHSALLPAYLVFLYLTALPPVLWSLAQPGELYTTIGVTVLLGVTALTLAARYLNQRVLSSLRLGRDNAELVRQLDSANAALHDEVASRADAQRVLHEILKGTGEAIGTDFFKQLVKHLANALGVRFAFIGEVRGAQPDRVTVIAFWQGGDYAPPFGYQLAHTPCETVVGKKLCIYPSDVRTLFPEDSGLAELGVEAYAGVPLFSATGEPLGLLSVMHDAELPNPELAVSLLSAFAARGSAELQRARAERDRHQLTQHLAYQATHDGLTGLLNRQRFEELLGEAVERAREKERSHALLFMDLDRFKVVNDTCGHGAGDQLLGEVANLLEDQVRGTDAVARIGGDEFGILLHDCGQAEAQRIGEGILKRLHEHRFRYDGNVFDIGASIGIVMVEGEGERDGGVTRLLGQADMACYAAKEAGRGRLHLATSDDRSLARHKGEVEWVSRVRHALDADSFVLYAQPICSLENIACDGAAKTEVLLRMRTGGDALAKPSAFLGAAERYGMSGTIDRWVVLNVFRWLNTAAGRRGGQVFINLSGSTVGNPHFLGYLCEQCAEHAVDAERIVFEITETAAITNMLSATRFIEELKSRGCRFALDDFGSGLSSLAYLKNLPVDYLKIDGHFVRDLARDPTDYAMVEAINRMGHLLGVQTIAEYVENDDIINSLREIGVDFVQGYGIARPKLLFDPSAKVEAGSEERGP